uniref:ADP ribosylation factor like GTPase 11 n=1 Tax=Podarcis muralis TaxID=64176 RepID=A0A670K6Q7_PODMU
MYAGSRPSRGYTEARLVFSCWDPDADGKTTLLYKLKLNETIMTIPTIGFPVETIRPINNVSFTMWDVCGQERVRRAGMVDSVDYVRFEEARSELEALLGDELFHEVPEVLLANKQDLPGAWPPLEVAGKMGLRKLQGHRWHVQGCSALTGEGIPEAMGKLAEMVKLRCKAQGSQLGRHIKIHRYSRAGVSKLFHQGAGLYFENIAPKRCAPRAATHCPRPGQRAGHARGALGRWHTACPPAAPA